MTTEQQPADQPLMKCICTGEGSGCTNRCDRGQLPSIPAETITIWKPADQKCACQIELEAMGAHSATDFDYTKACHCAAYPESEQCQCEFCQRRLAAGKKPADPGRGVGESAEWISVLERLKEALPSVGLNGWTSGVAALDWAIAALTQPKGERVTPEMWKELGRMEALADFTKQRRLERRAALSLPRQSEAVGEIVPHFLGTTCVQLFHSDLPVGTQIYAGTPQPAQADTTPAAHGVGE